MLNFFDAKVDEEEDDDIIVKGGDNDEFDNNKDRKKKDNIYRPPKMVAMYNGRLRTLFKF